MYFTFLTFRDQGYLKMKRLEYVRQTVIQVRVKAHCGGVVIPAQPLTPKSPPSMYLPS